MEKTSEIVSLLKQTAECSTIASSIEAFFNSADAPYREKSKLICEIAVKRSFLQDPSLENLLKLLYVCTMLNNKELLDANVAYSLIEMFFELLPESEVIESFAKVTEQFPFAKTKGLFVLKVCNEILKRCTSFASENVACFVLCFLASFFNVTERSGVNLRGDFNHTSFLFEKDAAADTQEKGAVLFSPDNVKRFLETKDANASAMNDVQNYFASLQVVLSKLCSNYALLFSGDNLLFSLNTIDAFVRIYYSKDECKPTIKLKKSFPMMLRINFEIFQSLYCIIRFIFMLQSLLYTREISMPSVPFPPQNAFAIDVQNRTKDLISGLYEALGAYFGETLVHSIKLIVYSEKCNLKWKAESCPAFEKTAFNLDAHFFPPSQISPEEVSLFTAAIDAKDLGSASWNRLWNVSSTSKDDLAHLPTFDEYIEAFVKQLDPDAGIEAEYRLDADFSYVWKAVRLLADSGKISQIFGRTENMSNLLCIVQNLQTDQNMMQ